ncbi:MAG: hypothetical protein AB1461_11565 [Thermodesulfobacteriota bacterium]
MHEMLYNKLVFSYFPDHIVAGSGCGAVNGTSLVLPGPLQLSTPLPELRKKNQRRRIPRGLTKRMRQGKSWQGIGFFAAKVNFACLKKNLLDSQAGQDAFLIYHHISSALLMS